MFCSRFSPRPPSCDCRRLAINRVGKKPALLKGRTPSEPVFTLKKSVHLRFSQWCFYSIEFSRLFMKWLHFCGHIFVSRGSEGDSLVPVFPRLFCISTESFASWEPSQFQAHGGWPVILEAAMVEAVVCGQTSVPICWVTLGKLPDLSNLSFSEQWWK